MANTFREKDFLIPIMCSYLSQSAACFMHSGFLLHIISNYAFQTLCGSPHNVCNEEGKNLGLPFNRPLFDENDLPYDIICGTFFVAGLGVEDFVSLTEEQIRRYKEHYDRVMVLTAAKETTPQHKPPHPHKYRRGVER